MGVEATGYVGGKTLTPGATGAPFRQDPSGAIVVQELHGRLYESNRNGKVFSDGLATVVSIANATYTIATLGSTCTPIAGLWNPSTSGVNAIIWAAILNTIKTALQNTGCGPFFWAASVGNTALTLGNTPLNRKSLANGGSACKGLGNIALTGLTTSLTVKGASALFGGSSSIAAFLETQVGMASYHNASKEMFEGELIVPPGGVLALLAGSTPVALSASSMLIWEEEPA